MSNTEHAKSLQDIANSLALNVCMEQASWDSPPEFRSQFDHDLALYVDEIRSIAAALSAQSAVQEPVGYAVQALMNGEWVTQHPIALSMEGAEEHASMYRDEDVIRILPLYTHPSSAAQVEEIRNAALNLMKWIEAKHRPPVRDEMETGRMVSVRLHALADLYDALKTPAPSKGK